MKRRTEGTEGYYVRADGTKDDATFLSELIGEDLTPKRVTKRKDTPPDTGDATR